MQDVKPLLVDLLQGALREIGRAVRAELSVVDLTIDQWRILRALDTDTGRTMGELAEAARLTPATATRAVDALVDRGFAYRHAPANDRRQVVVVAAAAGEQLFERLNPVLRECELRTMRSFGIVSSDELRALLMHVQDGVTIASR